jgi:hypothetical protein
VPADFELCAGHLVIVRQLGQQCGPTLLRQRLVVAHVIVCPNPIRISLRVESHDKATNKYPESCCNHQPSIW